MTTAEAKRPVSFWREVLPVSLLAAIVLFAAWEKSVVIAGLVFLPILLFLFVFYPTRLWWATIALVPLSIDLDLYTDTSVGMYLPTEPVFVGFMLLGVLYLMQNPVRKSFLLHPVVLALGGYFGWMAVSVILSSDFLVSLKRFTAQMWYVIPIILLGSRLLERPEDRSRFFRLYIFTFSAVVVYTLIRLAAHGFPIKEAEWLMQPFFKDHTLLGAVLGSTMPYVVLKLFEKNISSGKRILWLVLTVVYTIVLIETHSRAALLSLIIAAGLYVFIRWRVKFVYLIGMLGIVLGLLWVYQAPLMNYLEKNSAESRGSFRQNVESITNVSTDASNLERINRWNAALAMSKERPLFGWGPGTYQFVYAPFQRSEDLTIISTNIGDIGNAHSEYLGALAESGWPAMIFLFLFVLSAVHHGYRTVMDLRGKDRLILMAALLGFVAYFAHGVLNNFLNADKVSLLVWGFTVIIVHYSLESNAKVRSR